MTNFFMPRSTRRFAAACAALLLLLAACGGDGPTEAVEEHLRADRGFRVYDAESGRVLTSLTFFQVGENAFMGVWAGEIRVLPHGTLEVEVRWVDEDGEEFVLDPAVHAGYSLGVELSDSPTVTVDVQGNRAVFTALGDGGGARAEFQIVHGDHVDWTSGPHASVVVR